jgi:D-alanyl-D-alanine carboxypeptidase (penicillin-binding protein 5/6)
MRTVAALSASMLTLLVSGATFADTFKTTAPFAILTDHSTGTVLFEKAADTPNPPASLAKLMTVAVVFDAIRAEHLSLDDTFPVSERAWREGGALSGGTTTFLAVGSSATIADLLRGVIVQSGNDAAIVLAEGIAGSVERFADAMQRRADEIGLDDSRFTNPHGLPDPRQVMSARDLSLLASHLIARYPDLYGMFAERTFAYNKIQQRNRNRLLRSVEGADGLKTGWTESAGYGIVGSAVRDNRRLIVVVTGLKSSRARDREAKRLLEWGFWAFEPITLFGAGEIIGRARVFGGADSRVPLEANGPVRLTLPKGAQPNLRAQIRYRGPVEAPIAKGDPIGTLRITAVQDGRLLKKANLYAGAAVPPGSTVSRAWDALADLVLRHVW